MATDRLLYYGNLMVASTVSACPLRARRESQERYLTVTYGHPLGQTSVSWRATYAGDQAGRRSLGARIGLLHKMHLRIAAEGTCGGSAIAPDAWRLVLWPFVTASLDKQVRQCRRSGPVPSVREHCAEYLPA